LARIDIGGANIDLTDTNNKTKERGRKNPKTKDKKSQPASSTRFLALAKIQSTEVTRRLVRSPPFGKTVQGAQVFQTRLPKEQGKVVRN
jgi:hypothetical protein